MSEKGNDEVYHDQKDEMTGEPPLPYYLLKN